MVKHRHYQIWYKNIRGNRGIICTSKGTHIYIKYLSIDECHAPTIFDYGDYAGEAVLSEPHVSYMLYKMIV